MAASRRSGLAAYRRSLLIVGGMTAGLIAGSAATASVFYWDANGAAAGTGGAGTWNLSGSLWRPTTDTGTLGKWPAADTTAQAVFEGTAGTVQLGSGATLTLNSIAFTVTGYALTPNGASKLSFSGTSPTIDTSPGVSAEIKAAFTGSFEKVDDGTLTIDYFAGTPNAAHAPTSITVSGGTLKTGSIYAFGVGATPGTLIVNTGGTVDINGFSNPQTPAVQITNDYTQVGALSGTGGIITNNGLVDAPLRVGVGNSSGTSYAGVIQDGAKHTGLRVGDGTSTPSLTLTGANTYTGGTEVLSGTLQLDNSGAIVVASTTIDGGTLSGGTTGAGGTLNFRIVNDTSDLVSISSGLFDLTHLNLNLQLSGTQSASEYVLADKAVGSPLVAGSSFAGTSLPAGWAIDYDGTTLHPNDIVLVTPVPEPSAILLFGAGIVGTLAQRRRSQQV